MLATQNKNFKCIFEIDYVTFPHIDVVLSHIKKYWKNEMIALPSMLFDMGTQKKLKIFKPTSNQSPEQCIEFIMTHPGAILPNIFGLAIAELEADGSLPKDIWILGLDNKENLSINNDNPNHPYSMIPTLLHYSNGDTSHRHVGWEGDLNTDHHILLYCD